MRFIDIGNNTLINLEQIQRIEYDKEEVRAQIHWSNGKISFHSGTQASQLIAKVKESMPENWGNNR